MTANTRKLGRRQVDVLRAAAKHHGLVRFDDGGWDIGGHACTQTARRVAEMDLLVEGDRMAQFTFGVGSRPGRYMGLSTEGERVLAEWDRANPQAVAARERRAAAIKALAAKPGPITGDDLLRLAANDERLDDDTFTTLAPALRGEQPDLPTG